MFPINLPGGAIQLVSPKSLLWMRLAFDEEWRGTVMVLDGDGRLFSVEPLDVIKAKYVEGGCRLVSFRAPGADLELAINAAAVERVDPSTGMAFHPSARSILKFSRTLRLAVRETVEEVQAKLQLAVPALVESASRAARSGRSSPTRKRPSPASQA